MRIKEKLRQECFLSAVRENAGAFYRYAYSVLLNRQDAEDAVSEMILKAFEHLDDLRHIHKMRSWMFQILANICKTALSKRRYFDASDENVQKEVCHEDYTQLWESIRKMDEKFREVVILYYFECLKTREIAQILDISEGTVKSRLSRARDKLKEDLLLE